MIAETTTPCVIHPRHEPIDTYREIHHVIPQSWQAIWVPPNFTEQPNDPNWPFAGLSTDHPGLYLWDARRDPICRTGHGNVHFYIVKLMRWMSECVGKTPDEQEAYARTRLAHAYNHFDRHALSEAWLGIHRFKISGGKLETLWAQHSWGQI